MTEGRTSTSNEEKASVFAKGFERNAMHIIRCLDQDGGQRRGPERGDDFRAPSYSYEERTQRGVGASANAVAAPI